MDWSNLSLSEKSHLMRIYLENGISSLDDMIKHYNNFSEGGPISVNTWKTLMKTKYPDIEFDNNKAGYDYDEYFKNNYLEAIKQLQNLQHFPDTYKLPNHKTFSNESIYSRGPNMGGSWSENDEFTPSIINRQYYPDVYKEDRYYNENELYGNQYPDGGFFNSIINKARNMKEQAIKNRIKNNKLLKSLLSEPSEPIYDTLKIASKNKIMPDFTRYDNKYREKSWVYPASTVYDRWVKAGKPYKDNMFAVLDNYYLVAVPEDKASIGDTLIYELENGIKIPTIVADIKSKKDKNYTPDGHRYESYVSPIEFEVNNFPIVDKKDPNKLLREQLETNGWRSSSVKHILKRK